MRKLRVSLSAYRDFAPRRATKRSTRKFTGANNIFATIGGTMNSPALRKAVVTSLGGGGVTVLHTCTGSNGTPSHVVRIVTYPNKYVDNPYTYGRNVPTVQRFSTRLGGGRWECRYYPVGTFYWNQASF